jgi:aspartate/methionine/tyrosine aminotransferase
MFSSRVPRQLQANAFSQALAAARNTGRELIDLTVSNPTRSGIVYPARLFAPLSNPDVARYQPEPFGMRSARAAIAADYARRQVPAAWDRIVLTASTSEAYSMLFKLLCAPEGDNVLVPAPSYPLFDHLTALDGVVATQYALHYDGRWWIDFDSLDGAWTPRTRAVLAVSPNNPTGSILSADEYLALTERCASRNAALIVDEVFADYPLSPAITADPGVASDSPACLSFRLGGLSKSAALPQLKLGWIAIDGPSLLVNEALLRLELICDTYLSVSTPVQVGAPELIAGGADPRAQVLERVRSNYRTLGELASRHASAEVLNADAGWSAVIRVAARASEEEITLDLLENEGVVVYPGFFFDFPREAYLVVSLLPEPPLFHEGVRRVLERVDG